MRYGKKNLSNIKEKNDLSKMERWCAIMRMIISDKYDAVNAI